MPELLPVHRDIIRRLRVVEPKARMKLFGSLGKGEYRPGSDVDIAIFTKDRATIRKLREEADRIFLDTGIIVTIVPVSRDSDRIFLQEVEKGVDI